MWFSQPLVTSPKCGDRRSAIAARSASVAARPVSIGVGGSSTVPCAASTSATWLPRHDSAASVCSSTCAAERSASTSQGSASSTRTPRAAGVCAAVLRESAWVKAESAAYIGATHTGSPAGSAASTSASKGWRNS